MSDMSFREENGRVYVVDGFKPTMLIARELLEYGAANPIILFRSFRTITINCANGSQSYRMTSYDWSLNAYRCIAIP